MPNDIEISVYVKGDTCRGILDRNGIVYKGNTYKSVTSFCEGVFKEKDMYVSFDSPISLNIIDNVSFRHNYNSISYFSLKKIGNGINTYIGNSHIERLWNKVTYYLCDEHGKQIRKEQIIEPKNKVNPDVNISGNSDDNIDDNMQIILEYVQNAGQNISPEQKINIVSKLTYINNLLLN